MKNLIIPCAGKSTRFPNMKPKYLLTHPKGGILMLEGIKGLKLERFDKIYITILESHNTKYAAESLIKKAIKKLKYSNKFIITSLKKATKSQPDTVAQTIIKNNIEGYILIKDCDDYFETEHLFNNNVYYHNLSKVQYTNASNKSYITTNNAGHIDNIVEKRVISEDFCCGGYSFEDSRTYLKYYNKIKKHKDLYISHIIYSMIIDGINFIPIETENYKDWGTIKDWDAYREKYKTLFLDLDGVLVENSGEYTQPTWGETNQIKENCDLIRELYNGDKTQIIITTSRSEKYREKTISQLKRENIPYHKILFDLYHANRIIINDFAPTNPFPSCEHINLERNSKNLKSYLR